MDSRVKFCWLLSSAYFSVCFAFIEWSKYPKWTISLNSKTRKSQHVVLLNRDSILFSSSTPSSSSSHLADEEKAVGLSILVSFGNRNEFSDMRTLSGGQKSIVALAFIFAIQKCDPAPFYIFDEVGLSIQLLLFVLYELFYVKIINLFL